MADTITVYTITNDMKGKRPRQPLVQVIATGECADIQSFSFHPKHAAALARAIRAAGKAAIEGRRLGEQELDVEPR
jgi:hypothetical protein